MTATAPPGLKPPPDWTVPAEWLDEKTKVGKSYREFASAPDTRKMLEERVLKEWDALAAQALDVVPAPTGYADSTTAADRNRVRLPVVGPFAKTGRVSAGQKPKLAHEILKLVEELAEPGPVVAAILRDQGYLLYASPAVDVCAVCEGARADENGVACDGCEGEGTVPRENLVECLLHLHHVAGCACKRCVADGNPTPRPGCPCDKCLGVVPPAETQLALVPVAAPSQPADDGVVPIDWDAPAPALPAPAAAEETKPKRTRKKAAAAPPPEPGKMVVPPAKEKSPEELRAEADLVAAKFAETDAWVRDQLAAVERESDQKFVAVAAEHGVAAGYQKAMEARDEALKRVVGGLQIGERQLADSVVRALAAIEDDAERVKRMSEALATRAERKEQIAEALRERLRAWVESVPADQRDSDKSMRLPRGGRVTLTWRDQHYEVPSTTLAREAILKAMSADDAERAGLLVKRYEVSASGVAKHCTDKGCAHFGAQLVPGKNAVQVHLK